MKRNQKLQILVRRRLDAIRRSDGLPGKRGEVIQGRLLAMLDQNQRQVQLEEDQEEVEGAQSENGKD